MRLSDVLHALRALAARPGFAITAVLTLALGIGANVTIFSVIDTLLLRPLPYPHGDRLVSIANAEPGIGEPNTGSTVPDYFDQRAQADSLADVALYQYAAFNLSADGAPARVTGVRATPSLFSTLGVQASLGRTFGEDEAVAGRDKVAVISYAAWQSRFAGAADVVGRDLRLGGEAYRIVGVMPRGFFFPDRDVELWAPYAIRPEQRGDAERGHSDVESIGRLKAAATVAGLQTELATINARNAARSSQLQASYAHTGFTTHAEPLRDTWFGALRPTLWLLQGMVALVLLITGANVTHLVLARYSARQRDFALRSALGASRPRIALQVVTETLLLALLGGAAGLLLAWTALPLLGRAGFTATQRWDAFEIGISAHAIAFAGVLSLATGLLLGAITASALLRERKLDLLRSGARAGVREEGRVRNLLVVAQFALSLVLLTSAGLLLKSYQRLLQTSPGFSSAHLLSARLNPSGPDYADAAARAGYYGRLLDAVRAIPGVDRATYTSSLPFDGHLGTSGYVAEDYAGSDANALSAQRQSVDDDYFATMRLPLLEGRAFGRGDTAASAPVMIVSETMAQHLWPGRSALGRRISLGGDDPTWFTVVGVARAVRQNDLAAAPVHDAMYWPYRQQPEARGELVVESALPAQTLVPALRAAALAVDPQLPIYDVQSVDERIAHSLDDRRAPTQLLGAFALLALLLAAIGVYGVIAFSTAQRTAELGVRIAVGAGTRDIMRLVLGSGLRLCVLGIAFGAFGAFALGRLLRARLYEVGSADPNVFCGVALLLGGVAVLACWLPARRATRIDPVAALRNE